MTSLAKALQVSLGDGGTLISDGCHLSNNPVYSPLLLEISNCDFKVRNR